MGFLDTLKNIFIEEEEEITSDGPVEDVNINNYDKEDVKETKEEEKAAEEPVKTSVFINPTPIQPVVQEPVYEKPKVVEQKRTYEFSPIISPFFGANKEQQVSRVIPEPEKSKKPSKLGTIISPIYGYVDEDSKPKIMKTENIIDEDIENFSLEDIVEAKEEPVEEFVAETVEMTAEEKPAEIIEEPAEEKLVLEEVSEDEETETGDFFEEYVPDEDPKVGQQFYFADEAEEDDNEISFEELKSSLEEKMSVEEFLNNDIKKALGINEEETKEGPTLKETINEAIYSEDKTAEIQKAMQEYSEEDLFERDKQPTLFDI